MTDTQAVLGELYYRSETIRFGEFKLSAHRDNPNLPPSPFYMHYPEDGSPGSEHLPRIHRLVGQAFHEQLGLAEDLPMPHYITGTPNGALPLAKAHAQTYYNYPNNLLTFTKDNDETNQQPFDGPAETIKEDVEVVVNEDHVSGARNSLIFAAFLRGKGLRVERQQCVVYREQGGADKLKAVGIELLHLLTITELLRFGRGAGFVTRAELDNCLRYVDQNKF